MLNLQIDFGEGTVNTPSIEAVASEAISFFLMQGRSLLIVKTTEKESMTNLIVLIY